MKSLRSFIRSTVSAIGLSMLCMSPVWADDTDIFFGNNTKLKIYPNVVLIIDTSGSMGWRISGSPSTEDRLWHVQHALRTLVNDLNDVNVGIMRFSNPGGPVLYPVSYIDEEVGLTGGVSSISEMSGNADDAQQVTDPGFSQRYTRVHASKLDMPRMYLKPLQSWMGAINIIENDSMENSSGGSYRDYHGLEFLRTQSIMQGLRFVNSSIPDNAQVMDARVVFRGRNNAGSNNLPVYVNIVGEKDDSDSIYTNANFDISNRLAGGNATNNEVDWTIDFEVRDNTFAYTPNIGSIIQEIVDEPGWHDPAMSNESDIALVMRPRVGFVGTGERWFHSRNGSVSEAPRLHVDYFDSGIDTSRVKSLTGFRFSNVKVPRGATVTGAYISFSTTRETVGNIDLTIVGENSSSPTQYASSNYNISSRSRTAANVSWSGAANYRAGERIQSVDISPIVTEIAARSDWCGGNSMAFMIEGDDEQFQVWSRNGNPSLAARLHVTYDPSTVVAGNSCSRRQVTRRTNESKDDVDEWTDTSGTNRVSISNDTLRLRNSSDSFQGLRFSNLKIPQGVSVRSAFLEITGKWNQNQAVTVSIAAEDSANAAPYENVVGTVTGRSYLGSTVNWSMSGWHPQGFKYRSPNIASLVEGVLANPSWSSGNSMAFKLDAISGSGHLRAIPFDFSPGEGPRLIIEYDDDGSSKRLVRDELLEVIDQLNHLGGTPVQDTYYEAALYLMGKEVRYGLRRGSNYSYTRVSHPKSMVPGTFSVNRPGGCYEYDLSNAACRSETIVGSGGSAPRYKSPIVDECQKNTHIIMLTDGDANSPHSTALYPPLMGGAACVNAPTVLPGGSTSALRSGERCVKTLAKYMNTNDISPALNGDQTVTTHTVGFSFSSAWLEDVADEGGGTYSNASSAGELVKQITDIVVQALKVDTTFVAPVAAVNQFNRLNHFNQIYYSVFKPGDSPRWYGNVKRYKLGSGNTVVDRNDVAAIDASTGFFIDTAHSFWSASPDGKDVNAGGAAENIPVHSSRNVYTHYATAVSNDLTHSSNALTISNSNLTKAMFGTTALTNAQFNKLINWVRGKDTEDEDGDGVYSENRYALGDPLHSRPLAVTYGGTAAAPDVELFFGTNGGGLHAVNADTGIERFVFMPEQVLSIQNILRNNTAGDRHPYGMDGHVTVWMNDNGNNGIDTADPLDFVYIYAGMRRGGSSYFALDVTDRDNPKMLWTINGGGGAFAQLGQTWAKPVKAAVQINSTRKDVIIFTGGYDVDQDSATVQTPDTIGRAIYMVDAKTGALLWSGGKTGAGTWNEAFIDMDYSLPSEITGNDIDGDGLMDVMFLADVGGQVWRFDIHNGNNASDLVKGGVIADLGAAGSTPTIANSRRFFHTPSVALVKGKNGPEYAVAVGSGFHPGPLDTLADNRVYMISQTSVFSPPSSYTKLTESDLYDASANKLGALTGTALVNEQALRAAAKGWYIDLENGAEKSLSSPLITENTIIFGTFEPGATGSGCKVVAGVGRYYRVNLFDATPVPSMWGPSVTTLGCKNRCSQTELGGTIPTTPVTVCTAGEGCDRCEVGCRKKFPGLTPDTRQIKTYWRKEE